jgi:hypothetical protein
MGPAMSLHAENITKEASAAQQARAISVQFNADPINR